MGILGHFWAIFGPFLALLIKGEYSVRGSTFLPNPDPYFFLDFRERAKLNTVQIDTCGYDRIF